MTPGSSDLARIIEPVARALLGEPNRSLSTRDCLRFGSRGSLAVQIGGANAGTWFDHERGIGGGTLDLIADKASLAVEPGGALGWLREHGFLPPRSSAKPHIVKAYDYHDEHGALVFQVARLEPKDFRQRRPDGNGGWIWKMDGVERVPYRLPHLLRAPKDAIRFIVEGEKDADTLAELKLIATTSPGGASKNLDKPKWSPKYNRYFRGVDCAVIPDNDEAGEAHALAIAKSLHGTASSVRIVHLPHLPPKGDVSDWLANGGSTEELEQLTRETPLWEPPTKTDDPPPPDEVDPLQATIHRLAQLPELEFDRIKKTEAERLGLDVGILNRAIARARRAAKAAARAKAEAEAKAAKAREAKARDEERARKTAEARARLNAQKTPKPITDEDLDPLLEWEPPVAPPELVVSAGERPAIADAALGALAAARVPFYQRGKDAVRICLIKLKGSDGKTIRVPAVSIVTRPMLMRALGRCATWHAYNKELDLVRIDPPADLGDHILGMIGEWPFPPLRGVITTQTMRYDGTLLAVPGYDPATGLVLFNPPPMPPIPEYPTKHDALEAMALLRGLLDEVEFAEDDGVSLSGAVSLMMTPVLRGMMPVAPMHVITKPTAGTGGSYMQDITAAIALGERCPVLSLTQNNDAQPGVCLCRWPRVASCGHVGIELALPQISSVCGRYASFLPAEALARIFGAVNPLPNLEQTWNMAPTRDAPVVRLSREGERHLDTLKWGLVPYFTKDLKKARKPINARSETVATSGMFREAFAKRRCLVPAPVYYEWRDDPEGKVPFAVARVDGGPVAFGGIWETWKSPEGERLLTFATITTDANTLMAPIQDRMPVIVERADWPLWLGEVEGDVAALLRAAPDDVLRLWQVDKKVGQVRNDGPGLVKPIAELEPTLL